MKEQIYTIPVNEVYDTDCECPLCELEKKLEKETLDYALGAAMMEPEFRMESNEKGLLQPSLFNAFRYVKQTYTVACA